MKIFKTLFIFCLTLALFSCAKDIIDTTGSIIGTVSDARTGEPLSGVGISISPSGKTVTTAFDGRYELRDVPAQNYNVQAAKADYQTAQKSIAVNVGEESRLDFLLMPSVPNLMVSQNTMDFGSDATTQSIELSNDGFAALDWQIAEDVDWLSCLPTSGRIQAGEKTSVVVSIDRSGLARGNYSQIFSIVSNGGAQDVRVNMNVQGSLVTVAPEQLDFGPLSTVLPLTLKNNGTKSAAYSLSTSNAWLVLPKQSGTLVSTEQINVAVNREGLSEGDYSGEITLTADGFPIVVPVKMNIPSKAKPIVTFSGVTGVTYNEAQFTAGIVSVGGTAITRHGFCWGTSSAPTVDNNPNVCNFGDCNSLKEFTHKVTGLEESTTYYVRAYAENVEGVSYSNEAKFVTQGYPTIPEVETGAALNVSSSSAEFLGTLQSLGNLPSIDQYGHVWSTKSQPTVNDNKTTFGTTYSTGSFTSTLTGLQPHTLYHVRAYATNEKGTAYGEDVEFTTDYGTLQLKTGAVTDIVAGTAKVSGSITDKGGHSVVERGVCWAEGSAIPTVSDNTAKASTSSDNFTVSLSGLTEGVQYSVRAYVKTENGEFTYGELVTFTAIYGSVELETSLQSVDYNLATFGSMITKITGYTIAERGICWSLATPPTLGDNVIASTDTGNSYTSSIAGLTEKTTYYVRAYVKTANGSTFYSEILQFTTPAKEEQFKKEDFGTDEDWNN